MEEEFAELGNAVKDEKDKQERMKSHDFFFFLFLPHRNIELRDMNGLYIHML